MKKWFNLFATVWVGLSTHKLRSFLTILGVVIGVASVITLMSLGKGAEAQIISNIESMGSDLVTIRPGAFTFGGVRGAAGGAATLTIEDAAAISEQVPYISAVSPYYSSNLQLVVGGQNTNASVTGTTPEYMSVNNLEIASGTFFSAQD
jgi:putative ABC transport system permease protein